MKLQIFRTFLEKFRKDLRPLFRIFVARPSHCLPSELGVGREVDRVFLRAGNV